MVQYVQKKSIEMVLDTEYNFSMDYRIVRVVTTVTLVSTARCRVMCSFSRHEEKGIN